MSEGETGPRDLLGHERTRLFIKNPQDEQDHFYNEVLREMYSSCYGHVPDSTFRDMYFRERRHRWSVKQLIKKTWDYIHFQESDNPASSKRLIEQENLSSYDGIFVAQKLEGLDLKCDQLTTAIAENKERYELSFDGSIVKPRLQNQAEWYENVVSELVKVQEDLAKFKGKLTDAQEMIRNTFKGVKFEKKVHERNRSKRHNKRKSDKRQRTRDRVNSMSFLNKIVKKGVAEKCYPKGLQRLNECSKIKVTVNDLNEKYKKVIRPRLDHKYISLLISNGTFDDEVISRLRDVSNQKFVKSIRHKKMPLCASAK
jgi:hypothetical protein